MHKKLLKIASLMFVFIFLIFAVVNMLIIYKYSKTDEKQRCDVAVVLGAATDDCGVSPVYEERINHGIWLYKNNYVDYIIVTGGKGKGAVLSDAYKAKEYAISKGIPENVIFMEEKSKITQENLKYSKDIMENNGWGNCIIVSDPLHMKRAMLMAKDYKMDAVSSPTPTTRYRTWKTKLPFLLREVFFYVGYKVYDFLFLI